MDERDSNIISPQALPDEVDAIIRRRAAGHLGTVCMAGDFRDRALHFDGKVSFRMVRNFLRALRCFGE